MIDLKEILKSGGATLTKDLKKASLKSGFMVSILGMEKTYNINDNLEQLKKDIREYQKIIKNNEYIGLWIDNDIIYLDISKHYKDKKQAQKVGIINKQLAIYNIAKNENIYLTKNVYIIYKIDKIKNDLQYIKEYAELKEIQKEYNINNIYHFIVNDIDDINDAHLLKDRYIIFKDNVLINEI